MESGNYLTFFANISYNTRVKHALNFSVVKIVGYAGTIHCVSRENLYESYYVSLMYKTI